eukprot:GHRR01011344.1.p3 GENE.GHRR01011344.1~~GHRR01011344.1.p3  ORF type:complete len:111 (+),score=28.65 GHRR01011344.1:1340-1672(+)
MWVLCYVLRQMFLGGKQAYQHKTKVGPSVGLTRHIAGFQVASQLDTPGIMMPAVPADELGFKLALAGELCSIAVATTSGSAVVMHAVDCRHSLLAEDGCELASGMAYRSI